MRITSATLPGLALLALPLLVAVFDLGLLAALGLLALVLLWRWLLVLRALTASPSGPALRLETIGASHYVEKVRWCMDRLGVDYVEEQNLGTLGVFFVGRTVPRLHARTGSVTTSIGNSSDILRYLWGRYAAEYPQQAAFLAPTPAALELEATLDRYGVLLQQWIYHHLLDHPRLMLRAWGSSDPRVPPWQRVLARPLFPLLRLLMRRAFRLGPGRYPKTMQGIHAALDPLEQQLGDGRRYLLASDEPLFVDITLAALSGLWLSPPNYGGHMADGVRLARADLPTAMRDDMAALRERYPRLVAMMEGLYGEYRETAATPSAR
jgi:glutathione S-transferase